MSTTAMMNWSGYGPAASGAADLGEAVTINVPDKDSLLSAMDARLSAGQGFTVATLNLDHVVKLRVNPDFRAAYGRHTFVVADGNPIVWLSRLAGQEVALVPGSELVDPVMAYAARNGVPVCFLGSTEAALTAAANDFMRRYPELQIADKISPAMGFDPTGAEARACIDRIAASGARICLLALGAPKQEIFAAFAQTRLSHVGFLSIGAGLDFVAGTQQRAPAWMRAIAAEWLWRLLSNPRRLAGRYAACLAILPRLTLSALRARQGARKDRT